MYNEYVYICMYARVPYMCGCMYVSSYEYTYICVYIILQVSIILPVTGACYTSWTASDDASRGHHEV